GLTLAAALDTVRPEQVIAVVSLADGADVTVWRTTAAVAARRSAATVAAQIASSGPVPYATFLTWRGFLRREPPRRPDPQPPAASPGSASRAVDGSSAV